MNTPRITIDSTIQAEYAIAANTYLTEQRGRGCLSTRELAVAFEVLDAEEQLNREQGHPGLEIEV